MSWCEKTNKKHAARQPAAPPPTKHKILARFIMDPLSPVPSRMSLQQQHRITQQQRYTALLQHDRESEGRCGLCGVQTHRMCYRDSGVGSILCKEPLDVEGEVRRGRCVLSIVSAFSIILSVISSGILTSTGVCCATPCRMETSRFTAVAVVFRDVFLILWL